MTRTRGSSRALSGAGGGRDSIDVFDLACDQRLLEGHITRLFEHDEHPVEHDPSTQGSYRWSERWLMGHLPAGYLDCEPDVRDTAIVESLVNIISMTTSGPVREKALINLQCAPVNREVAELAVSKIAEKIANLHSTPDYPNDEVADALTQAFYTVASVSKPDIASDLIDHQLNVIRNSYKASTNSIEKAAIQKLGKLIEVSIDTKDGTSTVTYDVAEYVDDTGEGEFKKVYRAVRVGRLATSAVSTTTAVAILASPAVASADSPNRASTSGLVQDVVMSQMFNSIASVDSDIASAQIVTEANKMEPNKAAAVAGAMFNNDLGEHPMAAQVAMVTIPPHADGAKIIDKLINPKSAVKIDIAQQHPEAIDGLDPEALIKRRSLEQFGPKQGVNESPSTIENNPSKLERKQRTEVMKSLDELSDRVSQAVSERRISGITAAHIKRTLLPLLRGAVDDPSYISTLLSPEERESFVLDSRFGSHELVDKVIDNLDEDGSIVQWARSMDSAGQEDELSDGLVVMMLYGGIEAVTLTKAEANNLTGFEYAKVPEFVDTKIKRDTAGETNYKNYTELPDDVRIKSLKATVRELNDRALKERGSRQWGGWQGDTDELAMIYWDTAKRYNHPVITAEFLMAQSYQESLFDPKAGSGVAYGLSQFTLPTWEGWGKGDIYNPVNAVDAQARYMIHIYDEFVPADKYDAKERIMLALGGYNAGPGWIAELGLGFVDGSMSSRGQFDVETSDYVAGIESYMEYLFENLHDQAVKSGAAGDAKSKKQIEKLKEAGFTEYAENMANDPPEMVPMNIDRGNKWEQYINQNAEAIKQRLEDAGLDPNLGSLHMCGLVTIEMIAISESGDVATDEESMSKVYDQLIDTYIWARNHDVFTDPNGGAMWHAKMVDLANHLGLDVQTLPELSYPEIVRAFNNGVPYITINTNPQKLDANSPFKSGHVYAIDGVTADGKLTIIDPASYERTQRAYDPEKLLPYADLTAVHAMSAPGKMDSYISAVAADKAEAERKAKEEADKEAAEKAAKEKAAKEKAEKEAKRQAEKKAREESKEEIKQNNGRGNEHGKPKWDAGAMPDGWADHQQTIINHPISGTLDINKGELEVVRPGYTEADTNHAEVMLKPEAAKAFRAMNEAFRAEFGYDIPVNDSYRSFEDQAALHDTNRNGIYGESSDNNMAAIPGQSPHGWGNAVDIQVGPRYSTIYKWLIHNGPTYGFFNPSWMDTQSTHSPYAKKNEQWHFEFLGRSFVLDELVGGHPDYNMKAVNRAQGTD